MVNSISQQKLLTLDEVNSLVKAGQKLLLAGSELVLSKVVLGDWVGGTIPYFISEAGGTKSNELILTTILSPLIEKIKILKYDSNSISKITSNYFENGFSFIIIPAFTDVHSQFSKESSSWKNIFNQPLIGWVSGIDLDEKESFPQIFNGQTGTASLTEAIVMHIELKSDYTARANIINLFKQGQQDSFQFLKSGFEAFECKINGVASSFYDFVVTKKIDTQLPLVANYLGAMVNVSIREIDHVKKTVHLYAPVFSGVEYKFAEKLENKYEDEFNQALKSYNVKPQFACNCILNYLYANLQSKKTNITCAMTFGEIAYMLLNQTMVYLTVEKK